MNSLVVLTDLNGLSVRGYDEVGNRGLNRAYIKTNL